MPQRLTFLLSLFLFILFPLNGAGAEKTARMALAASGNTASASWGVNRPVLGFVLDAAGLRAISGIPGAAVLSRPMAGCGEALESPVISPKADYMLASAGENRPVVLCRNLGGQPVPSALEVPPAPSRILLSPNGATAALFYPNTAQIYIAKGLPGGAAISQMEASVRDVLAVSDGGVVLGAAPSGGGAMLLFLGPEGERTIGTVGRASAAAFLSGRDEAVVADSANNSVHLARGTSFETLAGERDGISVPAAVAVSADNREAVAANQGSGTLARIPLAGGAPALVACECNVSGFERLQGNSVFRIVSAPGAPVLIYDGDAQIARVVLVPPETGPAPSSPGRHPSPGSGKTR